MARGQNQSTGRTVRSEFVQNDRDNARIREDSIKRALQETMPAGSVENIIKQYERAKAYDERIKDMSADEIRKEVEGIKQFGVITNAQVDAIFMERNVSRKGESSFDQIDLKDRLNRIEREKALFARAVVYLNQRRTESPYDDVTAATMVLYDAASVSDEVKEFKSLSKKIGQDTEWLDKNSGIDGVSAEKRAVIKERLYDNQEALQILEGKSSVRLNEIKEVFTSLIGA